MSPKGPGTNLILAIPVGSGPFRVVFVLLPSRSRRRAGDRRHRGGKARGEPSTARRDPAGPVRAAAAARTACAVWTRRDRPAARTARGSREDIAECSAPY
ncbi:hypothetical protein SSP531S_22010 [Streptomyces spongiicola]|uniref:Uncharacterized protein n=1 Tax=Streptomyces spongiicola TaxID=1690221 RepID=A0A388SW37_9ACTN|nr:hypothetical protein SSP531S_22010 [Streptomyces spongiicola]